MCFISCVMLYMPTYFLLHVHSWNTLSLQERWVTVKGIVATCSTHEYKLNYGHLEFSGGYLSWEGWSHFAWSYGTDVYSWRWPQVKQEISWSDYLKIQPNVHPVGKPQFQKKLKLRWTEVWWIRTDVGWQTWVRGLKTDKRVCAQWWRVGGAGSNQGRITKGGDKVALICFFCESKLLSFPLGENYICNVI